MKNFINVLAYILVLVGAINWGLWGFFQFDLVAWLFGGNTTMLSRLIYAVVGLAGVWSLGSFGACIKSMTSKKGSCPCCGGANCNCNCTKKESK